MEQSFLLLLHYQPTNSTHPVTRPLAPTTCPTPFTMLTSVDKIVESFLHPLITPIDGIPTYDTLLGRIYQIPYNTVLMKTTIGSRKLGFLKVNVSPTVYATLYKTPFVKTPNPRTTLTILPNTTDINQTAIRYKFTLKRELCMLYHNMDKALNQHLLGVMEDIYIRALKKNYIGNGNHMCLEVINHLNKN